jgi:hypothetical protein
MANAIGDCFNIDYVNKRVYNNTTYTDIFTVRALYSYLQDQFDDLTQMDDTIPMSAQTPTNYTLINGWFMDDTSFKYLEGGAVETSGWLNEIQIAKVDGVVSDPIAGDIGKSVTADASPVGTLLAYEVDAYGADTGKWWIRTGSGTAIANNAVLDIPTGTGDGVVSEDSLDGECLWPNAYTLGSIMEDGDSGFKQQIYIAQAGSRIFSGTEWWPKGGDSATTRHIDVLIKTKEAGVEIDNGNITVYLRHYPDTLNSVRLNADLYDHFGIDLSDGGRNAVPLATSPDLNNTTDNNTVDDWNDIEVAFVNGTIAYAAVSGEFTEFETITGSSSGATGVFLYQTTTTGAGVMTLGNVVGTFNTDDNLTGATYTADASATLTEGHTMDKNFTQQSSYSYSVIIDCAGRHMDDVYEYLKYITRIGNTFTMYPTSISAASVRSHTTTQGQLYIRAHEDLRGSPTETFSPEKASPFGTFAGGKFFGAQGVWVQTMHADDVQAFQLKDSGGTTRTPPVQISISITNTLASDRIAVFRTTSTEGSTTIDKAMFSAAGANNTTGSSTFTVAEAIPSDTPTTGSVRIVDDSDTTNTREVRYTYTSWSGSAFNLSGTLGKTYTASDDKAYVPYIDAEATTSSISVTVIYASARYVLTRVRRYATTAILPFEVTGQVTSTGYSQGTIRTTDSIVQH